MKSKAFVRWSALCYNPVLSKQFQLCQTRTWRTHIVVGWLWGFQYRGKSGVGRKRGHRSNTETQHSRRGSCRQKLKNSTRCKERILCRGVWHSWRELLGRLWSSTVNKKWRNRRWLLYWLPRYTRQILTGSLRGRRKLADCWTSTSTAGWQRTRRSKRIIQLEIKIQLFRLIHWLFRLLQLHSFQIYSPPIPRRRILNPSWITEVHSLMPPVYPRFFLVRWRHRPGSDLRSWTTPGVWSVRTKLCHPEWSSDWPFRASSSSGSSSVLSSVSSSVDPSFENIWNQDPTLVLLVRHQVVAEIQFWWKIWTLHWRSKGIDDTALFHKMTEKSTDFQERTFRLQTLSEVQSASVEIGSSYDPTRMADRFHTFPRMSAAAAMEIWWMMTHWGTDTKLCSRLIAVTACKMDCASEIILDRPSSICLVHTQTNKHVLSNRDTTLLLIRTAVPAAIVIDQMRTAKSVSSGWSNRGMIQNQVETMGDQGEHLSEHIYVNLDSPVPV